MESNQIMYIGCNVQFDNVHHRRLQSQRILKKTDNVAMRDELKVAVLRRVFNSMISSTKFFT